MTYKNIRDHIYLTLARLYEKDPMHRKQYKQFNFAYSDNLKAQKILDELTRHDIVEQLQPGVVRLTDLGYQLIQPDLEKEHLMHVIEESLNEIYMFDSETLKFTHVNQGALSNIGYSMEEMINMTPLDIKPEYDLQTFHELIAPLKRKQMKKVVFETVHERSDGSLYPVEVHLQLSQRISTSVFVAFILDITERKKGEEEREKLIMELTRHNKDLRQFSYITSHNLRAPISNLTSLIYLIDNIHIENNELKEILEDFKISIQTIDNTIEDLTKILVIRENPSVKKEAIAFSEVFEIVLSQTKNLIEAHEPRIVCDFKEAPTVIFNKAYLESILLNLLTNSIKYRSSVRKPEIKVTTEDTGDHVLLKFQDNGIGLDIWKYKDKLFGLYQKFHEHTDSKGLGLYLVKSQVESLGGTIEARSEVDKGMTILIHFKKNEK